MSKLGDEGTDAGMDKQQTPMREPPAIDSLALERERRQARDRRDEQLADLLARASAGSASAFEAFYDATLPYAQALVRRMLPSADIEDILSDAFFQAWRELPRFDPERGSAVTWLLTIVRSRALDLLRHRRCSPETEHTDDMPEPSADAPGPETLLSHAQSNEQLHAALASLSPNERWVLGLAYYRDMPHAAISDATGLPLGTVKSLILRGQHKLRDLLTP